MNYACLKKCGYNGVNLNERSNEMTELICHIFVTVHVHRLNAIDFLPLYATIFLLEEFRVLQIEFLEIAFLSEIVIS